MEKLLEIFEANLTKLLEVRIWLANKTLLLFRVVLLVIC